ncbi:DUF4253 domain-containing protein [Neobacillus sp. C211]|uniref:DUF4253 domain-containing protein n=1 Tax=unclassified Neobacillus TaxID=2675272 RepID=UPI00397B7BB2
MRRNYLGILENKDQFKIIELMQTNGAKYNISNEAIISKLKEWNDIYPLTIICAKFDYVEFQFIKLIPDWKIAYLAQKVCEFCPDLLDKELSIEDLIKAIREDQSLILWWKRTDED